MSIGVSLEDLSRGHHTIFAYSSPAEQWDMLMPFIDSGLRRNERILYVASGTEIVCAQGRFDRSIAGAVERGQVVFEDSAGTYMAHGHFDGDRMKSSLSQFSHPYDPPGIKFSGDLDIGARRAVEQALAKISHSSSEPLVLDLREVSYIEAAVIAAIAVAANRINAGIIVRISATIAPLMRLVAPTLPHGLEIEEVAW